jgi:NADH-quinone oxidoreductase subunit N
MTLTDLVTNLSATMPLNVLVVWACALLLVDLFIPKERKGLTALLAALGMLVAMGFAIAQMGTQTVAFNGMVVVDGFAIFLTILFLGSGLVSVALAYDYLTRMGLQRGEYYVLLMFSITGMILMALACDLIVVFLALERFLPALSGGFAAVAGEAMNTSC